MGEQQAGLVKPIEGMEQLILYHCSPEFLVRGKEQKTVLLDETILFPPITSTLGLFVLEYQLNLSNCSEKRTEEEKEGQTHSRHTCVDYLLAEASGCCVV